MWLIGKWSSLLSVFVITLALLAALASVLTLGGCAKKAAKMTPPPAPAPVPPYPDTTVGLEQLMGDMLSLQKNGDTASLAPYLQSLLLPASERWFVSKFGDARCGEQELGPNDCLGPRMAFTYRSLAKVLPASFSLTLTDLLHEGLTNFEATNYTEQCPGPQRIVGARELVGGLTTTPYLSPVLSGLVQHREPVYVLWAYNETKETTLPFFVYFEGAFRYLGMLHPASDEDFRKASTTEENSGPVPSARYLTEDQLELKKVLNDASLIQRTVVLHVVTGPDGEPTEVTYVRGPETAKDAAIKSVEKRHFDLPSLQGIHPNTFSFCLSVVAPS